MTDSVKPQSFWHKPTLAVVLMVILAFLFNWPYLKGGFYADDFLIINMLEKDPLPFSRWLGVWAMQGDIPCFDNLWWKDAGWAASFWRPISSLVIEASLAVFGRNPFALHLLSILLHAGIAACLYLLVRRLTNGHFLAIASGLFYVSCEDHSFGIGWISTITDPLGVFFTMLALLGHVIWLQKRRLFYLIGSILALLISLGCKESAAIAPAGIILLTMLAPDGKLTGDPSNNGAVKYAIRNLRDFVSWMPAAVILLGFPIVYLALGLAEMNNLGYINPLTDPIRFLSHLVLHLPVFWLGTLTVFPPFSTWFWPELLPPVAFAGLIIFIIWLSALWSFKNSRLVIWSFIFYFVTLLPQLGTDASERGLYFPMIPASILLAMLAINIGPVSRRLYGKIVIKSRWTRFVGWLTIITVLIPAIIISILRPWALLPALTRPEREMRTVLPHIQQAEPEKTIILNTSGFSLTFYTHDIVNWHSKELRNIWLLSSANAKFDLVKTGDSSFIIHADRGGWLDNPFARILRNKLGFEPGEVYKMPFFTATVLETTPGAADVLSVRFEFDGSLESKEYLFLNWDGRGFRPFDFTAIKIGETVRLADTSDLLKAMM